MTSEASALAARYRRFASHEARGRSPLYEALAESVAADPALLDFLLGLPEAKRQPNLLLASVRVLHGLPANAEALRRSVLHAPGALADFMLAHATQTNEPARCATLLPVLAALPQPLALIEVGASAGLCLLPDFYAYYYGGTVLRPQAGDPPVFTCRAGPGVPLPAALPQVVWRAGLDLNPLDAADPEQRAWLEALVWPEQAARLSGLRGALDIAARERPPVHQGDLLGGALEALCRTTPAGIHPVIFHTAVLAYVPDQADRAAFGRRAMALGTWIANEAPGILPGTIAPPGRFVLSVNGKPRAHTDPHGAALDWLA
jgi:hypothetical protein